MTRVYRKMLLPSGTLSPSLPSLFTYAYAVMTNLNYAAISISDNCFRPMITATVKSYEHIKELFCVKLDSFPTYSTILASHYKAYIF